MTWAPLSTAQRIAVGDPGRQVLIEGAARCRSRIRTGRIRASGAMPLSGTPVPVRPAMMPADEGAVPDLVALSSVVAAGRRSTPGSTCPRSRGMAGGHP